MVGKGHCKPHHAGTGVANETELGRKFYRILHRYRRMRGWE